MEEDIRYTDDIADYNSKEYPIYSKLFLEEIPLTAKIESFYYYAYYNEECDVYLELKFDNIENLEHYISNVKKRIKEEGTNTIFLNGSCFLENKNPYDESFTDLFCSSKFCSTSHKNVSGYKVKYIENERYIEAFYEIISYSLEDLTVILTYSGGWFSERYIPKYFDRFNVPLDNELERYEEVEFTYSGADNE